MKLHRELTEEEKEPFRQWARENYKPFTFIDGCWHPVTQLECVHINQEAEIGFKYEHAETDQNSQEKEAPRS